MRDKVVIDASVAGKWFLNDELGTAEARALLQRIALGETAALAPTLLVFEFCNLMQRAVRQGRVSRDSASDSVNDLLELPIRMSASNRMFYQDVVNTALDYGLTAHDAAYLALARAAEATLATGDVALATAAGKARVKTIRIGL